MKTSEKLNMLINLLLAGAAMTGIVFSVYCGMKLKKIETVYREAATSTARLSDTYIHTPVPVLAAEETPAASVSATDSVISDESMPVIDFNGLNSECTFGSVAGWLFCEGTNINNPIAQCEDNSYYLYRLLDGTENISGTLFTDYRCREDFMGTNTIVYGHNMLNGTMFGELAKYINEQDFFEAHPDMILYTPYGNYRAEVFSAFVTVTSNEAIWQTEFTSDQDYQEFLDYVKSENRIPSGPDIEVSVNDRIITLVTCAFDTDHSRTVVLGKLTEIS